MIANCGIILIVAVGGYWRSILIIFDIGCCKWWFKEVVDVSYWQLSLLLVAGVGCWWSLVVIQLRISLSLMDNLDKIHLTC